MDVLLLLVTAGISRLKTSFARLTGSAAVAAFSAVLAVVTIGSVAVRVCMAIVLYVLVPYIMIRICFGGISIKQRRRTCLTLYGVVFCAGGIIQMLALHTMLGYRLMTGYIGNKLLYTSIIIFVAFSFYAVRVSYVRGAYGDGLCQVTILFRGEKYRILGLVDTGNRLRDPIYGKAVHVMNGAIVKDNLPDFCHYIPYHSVGTEHGVIPVFFADSMEINMNGKVIVCERPEIAIYGGEVSSDREYDILLHCEFLK